MTAPSPVVVIGGGVAGCAAAVASAEAGAPTILIEASRALGGVAVHGEHRTLCGLAPIDAARPELLEPSFTSDWITAIVDGSPYQQGRVWLWPTNAVTLQRGLRARLMTAKVDLRLGTAVSGAECSDAGIMLRMSAQKLLAGAVIDASGAGVLARLLGLPYASPSQWPAHRSLLHVPALGTGAAARVSALRRAQAASGSGAALALVPVEHTAGNWQLSCDVAPGTSVATAAAMAERIAIALDGTVLTNAVALAQRDHGRPTSNLGVDELFADQERGLCWAAWPREEHGPDGVTWQWPISDRHGIPERAVRLAGVPDNVWCIGKGAPVTVEAAAALRVTGTCLAMGAAVGARAAALVLSRPPDRAH